MEAKGMGTREFLVVMAVLFACLMVGFAVGIAAGAPAPTCTTDTECEAECGAPTTLRPRPMVRA